MTFFTTSANSCLPLPLPLPLPPVFFLLGVSFLLLSGFCCLLPSCFLSLGPFLSLASSFFLLGVSFLLLSGFCCLLPSCFLSLGPFLSLASSFFLGASFLFLSPSFFGCCFLGSFFLSWGLPCCPFLASAMAFASFLYSAEQTSSLLHAASSFLHASVGFVGFGFCWAFALHSISFLHNAFFWQAFLSASNSLLPSFLGCGLTLALSFVTFLLPSLLGVGFLAFLSVFFFMSVFFLLFMTFFTTSANSCLPLPL